MSPRKPPAPPPIEVKRFTPEEIERGIAKLNRRIVELEAFDALKAAMEPGDASTQVLARDIRDTVADVFGLNSQEARDFHFVRIWAGPSTINMGKADLHGGYKAGQTANIQKLQGLIKRLEEKRGDLGADDTERTRLAFRGLNLHPRIADVATDLYLDGHYDEAVFAASKALVNLVKEKSGSALDGARLMFAVFQNENPVLAFNDLQTQTDKDEQEGMMHLLAGAVLAIRNPGGHDFPEESPDRTLELIAFLSLLANRVQGAKKGK